MTTPEICRVLGYVRNLADGQDEAAALIVSQLPEGERVKFIELLGHLAANLAREPDGLGFLDTMLDLYEVQALSEGPASDGP